METKRMNRMHTELTVFECCCYCWCWHYSLAKYIIKSEFSYFKNAYGFGIHERVRWACSRGVHRKHIQIKEKLMKANLNATINSSHQHHLLPIRRNVETKQQPYLRHTTIIWTTCMSLLWAFVCVLFCVCVRVKCQSNICARPSSQLAVCDVYDNDLRLYTNVLLCIYIRVSAFGMCEMNAYNIDNNGYENTRWNMTEYKISKFDNNQFDVFALFWW